MVTPFGLWVDALIGAAGSVINGIGSLFTTNKTNKANMQMTRETNATNERINQSQLDYNWDMWNATNNYNNPKEQRQRLVDAGLNPIYYGLDGNSSATGNAFTPIPAQQSSPNVTPDISGFGNALEKYAQIKNLEADTQLKESQSGLTDEQKETERQLRSGSLIIQGQQIKLNEDEHALKGAELQERLTSIEVMKQNIAESEARIADYKSQMSYRQFEMMMDKARYELDKKVRLGLLSVQEQQLALSWFEAETGRMNAHTNYFNAQTQRGVAVQNAMDQNITRGSRMKFMDSMSHFNNENAKYVHSKNDREDKAFSFEQIDRAANAFIAVSDALFAIPNHVNQYIDDSLGRASKILPFVK